MAFFFFSSVIAFIRFLESKKLRSYLFSLLLFIGALLSKEFAVMLPFVFGLVFLFFRWEKRTSVSVQSFFVYLTPFLAVTASYLYLHIFHYGLAEGDSYIWIFSLRAVNTLFWYFLWSLNLPEMLVDFIGPGLRPLPNLFKYYGGNIVPILGLFSIMLIALAGIIVSLRNKLIINLKLVLFCGTWFLVTLMPVVFLPWHKFAYELTVPLMGIVILLAFFLNKIKTTLMVGFLGVWLATSVLTNILTYKTHWITQGGKAAQSVFQYFNVNSYLQAGVINVIFYDIPADKDLPWSPSVQLQTVLSKNNFFDVFYGGKIKAYYFDQADNFGDLPAVRFEARQFLGYK